MKMKTAEAKNPSEHIPVTWLDPLLTGENAVMGDPPYSCDDIERLLIEIKSRIKETEESFAKERANEAFEKGEKEGMRLANLRYGPFKPRFQG